MNTDECTILLILLMLGFISEYFKEILGIIKDLNFPKTLLVLTRRYKILQVLTPVLFAQFIATLSSVSMLIVLAGFVLIDICNRGLRHFFSLSIFLLTLFVSLMIRQGSFAENLTEAGVSVRLIKPYRINASREISFDFKIENLNHNSRLKLLLNKKIRCKYAKPNLLAEDSLQMGGKYYIKAKFVRLDQKQSYDRSLISAGYRAKCKILFISDLQHSNILSLITKIRSALKKLVYKAHGSIESKTVLMSMGFGIDDETPVEIISLFKVQGLAHLLVVSGHQVTILYFMMYAIVLRLFLFFKASFFLFNVKVVLNIMAILLAICFAALTGFDTACRRAVLALVIFALKEMLEINTTLFDVILATLLVENIFWPFSLQQLGSQLTYAALLGICMGVYLAKKNVARFVLVSFFASLNTSLVIYIYFDLFYPTTFFNNLVFSAIGSFLSINLAYPAILLATLSGYLTFFLSALLSIIDAYLYLLKSMPVIIIKPNALLSAVLFSAVFVGVFLCVWKWLLLNAVFKQREL